VLRGDDCLLLHFRAAKNDNITWQQNLREMTVKSSIFTAAEKIKSLSSAKIRGDDSQSLHFYSSEK